MYRRYTLCYVLDDKEISFSFSADIDFEKYNSTILSAYGKKIKHRYVMDNDTGDIMSLKRLRLILKRENQS